ncbi:uncharacterized protein isoform X2 [Leptinotarsa decemlineata]|uniref:uncharacterized protein isoform X2 n=1 Tax=Leptinotarsa decemlineata TaxID=7539 RepID=UPI003D3043EC
MYPSCRTCMKENADMNSIFDQQTPQQQISLKVMLKYFASVEIEQEDGLPETVCKTCEELIYSSYNFKKLCEKSDKKFRKSNDFQNQNPIPITPLVDKTHTENNKNFLNRIMQFDNVQLQENYANSKKALNNYDYVEEIGIETDSDGKMKEDYQLNSDVSKLKNVKNIERSKKSNQKSYETKSNQMMKNKEKVPCNICDKSFRYRSELERHKLTHSGDKPYLCNICGEKPYKCQLCDSRFSAPGTLMTHTRTHTGDRPHTCKICGKSFPQPGYLSTHMRTHTGEKPIKCKICNQQFNQKGSLIAHMRIHSGEKPYPCEECGKSFAVRSTLVKHTRTHTGERPYTCEVCGQKFAQSGTLVTHMKVHQLKKM